MYRLEMKKYEPLLYQLLKNKKEKSSQNIWAYFYLNRSILNKIYIKLV